MYATSALSSKFEQVFALASLLDALRAKDFPVIVVFGQTMWNLDYDRKRIEQPYHLWKVSPVKMQHGWRYRDILDVASRIVKDSLMPSAPSSPVES